VTLNALSGDPTLGKLAEFLRGRYPQLENLKVLELHELGEGWETDLYQLKLAGSQGGEPRSMELVLRLFKGNDPLEKAQKESSLMTGVSRFGIATPRVDALVTDSSILQYPFVVMEHIQGGTLEEKIAEEGAAPWLDPMMKVLARIHSVPWGELVPNPKWPYPESDDPLAYVRGLLDEMDQTIEQFNLVDFKSSMSWLREREDLGSAAEPALIHNDYHPQNILLRDASLVVIDWSFAEIGDIRMDLAWSILLFEVMAGGAYRSALIEAYEQSAGMRIENLDFFEALKFALRMVTIGTWLDETVEIPVAGITRQAIRSDYKVHVMNPYRRLREITGIEIKTIEEL
jgi:aminoglycoside phosphotransferase (APT) family kinase protein